MGIPPLETSLVEWKPVRRPRRGVSTYLGNFLSGMETQASFVPSTAPSLLGNFLSGMETRRGPPPAPWYGTLETSLVEWKPENAAAAAHIPSALGNFLSGMETDE